jgi:predicted solute-binding protein
MAEVGSGVWDERIHTKNKTKYEERVQDINTGYTVQVCNKIPAHIAQCIKGDSDHDGGDIQDALDYFDDINYEWYIKEANKLVKPLMV